MHIASYRILMCVKTAFSLIIMYICELLSSIVDITNKALIQANYYKSRLTIVNYEA